MDELPSQVGVTKLGTAQIRTTKTVADLTVALMARLDLSLVGERIRQARRAADLTQEELADVIGVHKRTIENYERAKTKPFEHINAIAEATATSVLWLLHGDATTQPGTDLLVLLREIRHVQDEERAAQVEALSDLRERLRRLEAHLSEPGLDVDQNS